MKVENVNSNGYHSFGNLTLLSDENSENKSLPSKTSGVSGVPNCDSVSFKGKPGGFGKRFWFLFRRLSNYMKEPSEMTNALIAAIGTGAIAPFAIMCSPAKKTDNAQDKKAEREKKAFQALRQPVSAALAFGFQVPTTIGIAALFNHGAYEKHWKIFRDAGEEGLQNLIPDKKYLAKQAKKALGDNSSEEIKAINAVLIRIPMPRNLLQLQIQLR